MKPGRPMQGFSIFAIASSVNTVPPIDVFLFKIPNIHANIFLTSTYMKAILEVSFQLVSLLQFLKHSYLILAKCPAHII